MSESVTWQGNVEAELELDITINCGECGDELEISSADISGESIDVSVDPCKCATSEVRERIATLLAEAVDAAHEAKTRAGDDWAEVLVKLWALQQVREQ